jgi:hypothetical protein
LLYVFLIVKKSPSALLTIADRNVRKLVGYPHSVVSSDIFLSFVVFVCLPFQESFSVFRRLQHIYIDRIESWFAVLYNAIDGFVSQALVVVHVKSEHSSRYANAALLEGNLDLPIKMCENCFAKEKRLLAMSWYVSNPITAADMLMQPCLKGILTSQSRCAKIVSQKRNACWQCRGMCQIRTHSSRYANAALLEGNLDLPIKMCENCFAKEKRLLAMSWYVSNPNT